MIRIFLDKGIKAEKAYYLLMLRGGVLGHEFPSEAICYTNDPYRAMILFCASHGDKQNVGIPSNLNKTKGFDFTSGLSVYVDEYKKIPAADAEVLKKYMFKFETTEIGEDRTTDRLVNRFNQLPDWQDGIEPFHRNHKGEDNV